ncbi:AraC family transcriptional regulator [Mameliella alba]|uniref:AraC family transcriptional regulator n=1 Tax=Mameliella alba TaxID=561184 RepID=UPI001430209A|nr:AraC family transcriptional regulator [Mameliella alba]
MPTVTAAFVHALTAAANLALTPDGEILSGGVVVHQVAPLKDGQLDDQSFFDLICWIARRHPDRVSLMAAYAEAIRMDDLGVLGLALKTAPTLRASVVRLERYFRLLTDTAVYRLDSSATPARLVLEGRTPDHPALTLRNECALAGFARNARDFVRDGLRLEFVTFRHRCSDDPARYEAHFGCPVLFGADRDSIALSAHSLELPNRLGDKALSDFLTSHLDKELGPTEPEPPLRADLCRRLSTALSTGIPRAASLARDMGMSERTFFRRLSDEGTTYRDVVREVQIKLARDLLEHSECSIAEVAFLTGFAEQSAFGRAFKRWVGQAPAQYRNRACDVPHLPQGAVMAGTVQRLAGGADTVGAVAV